jgi:hypothetical protein
LASTVTSGEYPFLPAFAENAGFDLAKVTRIQVDNKVRDRLLPERNGSRSRCACRSMGSAASHGRVAPWCSDISPGRKVMIRRLDRST